VIAIIGILVALLLPAVQAAREAARRMQCGNNSKQIGLALHNYHDTYKTMPMAYFVYIDPRTGLFNMGSWGKAILPFAEQQPIADMYNDRAPAVNEFPVAGPANVAVISNVIEMFVCPSAPGAAEDRIYDGGLPAGVSGLPLPALTWRAAPSDYCASTGVFNIFSNVAYSGNGGGQRHGVLQDHINIPGVFQGSNRGAAFRDITDGTSNTFVVGERTGGPKIYSRKNEWRPTVTPAAMVDQIKAAQGGGWGDALNGQHWLGGTLHSGLPDPPQHGPAGINSTNLRSYNFHGFHPGGCNFVMADGSVQFVSETDNAHSVAARITRQKGETFQ